MCYTWETWHGGYVSTTPNIWPCLAGDLMKKYHGNAQLVDGIVSSKVPCAYLIYYTNNWNILWIGKQEFMILVRSLFTQIYFFGVGKLAIAGAWGPVWVQPRCASHLLAIWVSLKIIFLFLLISNKASLHAMLALLPPNPVVWGHEIVLVLGLQSGTLLPVCGAVSRDFQGGPDQQCPCWRDDVWL